MCVSMMIHINVHTNISTNSVENENESEHNHQIRSKRLSSFNSSVMPQTYQSTFCF